MKTYTTCQVEFNNARSVQAYTYLVDNTLASELVKGDIVIVEARDWFGVARVLNVDPIGVPNEPENAQFKLKWVCAKFVPPAPRGQAA